MWPGPWARCSSARFSLAYVTYSFILNASRGLATDPLLVRFSGSQRPAWRRAVGSCTGTAVAVGLVGGAAMLAVAMMLGGTARIAFFAMGLTMPGLMLQDSWRFAFFAASRGGQAFLNDMIWAAAMVPGLLALKFTGHETVLWFVLVWGASANVAAAAGPFQARVIPRLLDSWTWVIRHRDLSFRYLAEETLGSVTGQVRAYGLAAIVGLAAVGSVQAASTLMGPFLMVLTGVSLVSVPEATRVLRNSPRHLRLLCVLIGGGLAAAALLWCAVLLVALPRGLGDLVAERPAVAADVSARVPDDDRRYGSVLQFRRDRWAAGSRSGHAQPAGRHVRLGDLHRRMPDRRVPRRSRGLGVRQRGGHDSRRSGVVATAADRAPRGRCAVGEAAAGDDRPPSHRWHVEAGDAQTCHRDQERP